MTGGLVQPEPSEPRRPIRAAGVLPLLGIAAVAIGLRVWRLDHWSLWYDEVVTTRLARADGPAALLDLIRRIDATRAPLYPLVLMGWLRVFGPSDLAARSLGALLGVATVGLVYGLGRSAFDERTGRFAAWLCAVCPTLVTYAQEVRMYALLVPLTIASWWTFLGFRARAGWGRVIGYAGLLAALIYAHPVGLFMVVAHGLAYLALRRSLILGFGRWLTTLGLTGMAVLPWIGRYFDHPPEYLLPRYPIRFLLSVPIEYIGGNSLTLIPLAALIGLGLLARSGRSVLPRDPLAGGATLIWFVVPPTLLYGYSMVGYPIFGPARIHLFVAPAYLLLVAQGLAILPRWGALAVVALALPLTAHGLATRTYAPGVKADYRALAADLRERGEARAFIGLHVRDRQFPYTQFEAARYYLEPPGTVILDTNDPPSPPSVPPDRPLYLVDFIGPDAPPHPPTPDTITDFYGLIVRRGSP